jgi:hypothetical protein
MLCGVHRTEVSHAIETIPEANECKVDLLSYLFQHEVMSDTPPITLAYIPDSTNLGLIAVAFLPSVSPLHLCSQAPSSV